jgi:hypothetical protein
LWFRYKIIGGKTVQYNCFAYAIAEKIQPNGDPVITSKPELTVERDDVISLQQALDVFKAKGKWQVQAFMGNNPADLEKYRKEILKAADFNKDFDTVVLYGK